jgi:opacity protein-like surface antigen
MLSREAIEFDLSQSRMYECVVPFGAATRPTAWRGQSHSSWFLIKAVQFFRECVQEEILVRIMKCSRFAFLVLVVAFIGAVAAHAQFDISAGYYEAFTSTSSGTGTKQIPTNSGGEIAEVRYLRSPLFGLGMSYSYNRANQTIEPNGTDCQYTCANPTTVLTARASEIALDWIPSLKVGKSLRPFAIGGVGFFITSPGDSTYEVNTIVRPVFVVGGGVDWSVLKHFGVRLQYRDNIYKAPDLSALYPASGAFTSSSEPTGGLFFRF